MLIPMLALLQDSLGIISQRSMGIGQWGKDPDAQTETTDINTSTIDQNFKESPSTIRPPSGSDTLDELFLLFQSLQTGMTVGSDEDLRNFQKFYILLWLI